jgi:hypothetical protein
MFRFSNKLVWQLIYEIFAKIPRFFSIIFWRLVLATMYLHRGANCSGQKIGRAKGAAGQLFQGRWAHDGGAVRA